MTFALQFHDAVLLSHNTLSDVQKSVIAEKIAQVDKCLVDGADEYLQLLGLTATAMKVMAGSN